MTTKTTKRKSDQVIGIELSIDHWRKMNEITKRVANYLGNADIGPDDSDLPQLAEDEWQEGSVNLSTVICALRRYLDDMLTEREPFVRWMAVHALHEAGLLTAPLADAVDAVREEFGDGQTLEGDFVDELVRYALDHADLITIAAYVEARRAERAQKRGAK